MKKIVLVFGLVAGAVLSAMMLATLPFHDAIGFDRALLVGYTSMVLAFLLIYFGVRSYRDTVGGGTVRFGRAFVVGALIGLVASLCYVATWEVVYFNFMPDYLSKYQAHVLGRARADGASEEALARQKAELDRLAEQYRNPAFNAAVTFLEPLPVARVVALVSAGVLSRRKRGEVSEGGAAPGVRAL
jgi:hypothetical protein